MTRPLYCLIGWAGWAILLVLALAVARVSQVLGGSKKPTEFPGGVQHGGDRYWRLNRAHVNAVENLPIFGAIVLVGSFVHVSTPAFLLLPAVALAARVVQSLVHIASGRAMAVNLRFTAFLVQLACFLWMGMEIVRAS